MLLTKKDNYYENLGPIITLEEGNNKVEISP